MTLNRRTFASSVLASTTLGLAGCQTIEQRQQTRTRQPLSKVRAGVPESVDQTFEATVEEWTESRIEIRVTTKLTGPTEDFEPTRTVIEFNEDDRLQDRVLIAEPQFGKSVSATLEGKIGRDEKDVSLSSHTEFDPDGSLSIHYTKPISKER